VLEECLTSISPELARKSLRVQRHHGASVEKTQGLGGVWGTREYFPPVKEVVPRDGEGHAKKTKEEKGGGTKHKG